MADESEVEDWGTALGPKYIVMKLDGEPVDDAVVIRLKDPFAATALHTYCNTIQSVLELGYMQMGTEDRRRMMDISDYFHEKALESEKITGKRLPD
jgi:hypothetical protein